MAMTRTDFKAIAEVVRKYKVSKEIDEEALRGLIEKMCIHFAGSNQTFNKMDFLRRCGWYNG